MEKIKVVSIPLSKGVAKITMSYTILPWYDRILGKHWKEIFKDVGGPEYKNKKSIIDKLGLIDVRIDWSISEVKLYGTKKLTGNDIEAISKSRFQDNSYQFIPVEEVYDMIVEHYFDC